MKYRSYIARIALALGASLALAGCAKYFPPYSSPAKPSTAVSSAAAIAVYATKAGGDPAGDVLIYAQPLDKSAASVPGAQPAVLDILDRHFEPAILPVRAGGSVTIQNLDDVPHDIYSFSSTRPLSLHLAAGERHAALSFNHPGVVTVGCKIYNEMQGYIYVTDAPYFGTTDSHGFLRLTGLPPGRYKLGAWRAGSSDRDLAGYPRTLTLKPGTEQVVRVRL